MMTKGKICDDHHVDRYDTDDDDDDDNVEGDDYL